MSSYGLVPPGCTWNGSWVPQSKSVWDASWKCLMAILGCLGMILEKFWGILEASWGPFGNFFKSFSAILNNPRCLVNRYSVKEGRK